MAQSVRSIGMTVADSINEEAKVVWVGLCMLAFLAPGDTPKTTFCGETWEIIRHRGPAWMFSPCARGRVCRAGALL
jgi:hypothetical protein